MDSQQVPAVLPASPRELTRIPLIADGVVEVDQLAKPPPGKFVDLRTGFGTTRTFLRETPGRHGASDTAVYVHGLAGSSANWTDLAIALSGRLRGVALDLPGFGKSAPPALFDYTRQAHAHVVIRLLEDLGTPVHLFGNSFGGAVAIEVAARRPDLVATLTLISPAMPDLRPDLRRVSDRRIPLAYLPLIGRRARRELAAMSARERCESLMRLCFADPAAVPEHRVDEATEELAERAHLPWAGPALGRTTMELLRSWVAPGSQSLWLLLERVTAPGLVVWGSQDRLVSVRKAPRTARSLRRGRLLVLPRTGHVAQMERPYIVARAVAGMLDAATGGRW